MSKLSDFLAKVARFAQKHPALFRAVAGAIAALAAVIIVLNIAMGAYTAITTLAAAATWATLAPILLIIGAVALLAIGFILLWKKSETFRDIVTGVWEAVKTAALFYFGIVKAYVQTVIAVLKAVWKTLQPVVEAVWEKVKTFTGIAVDYIQDKWAKWFPIIKAAFQDLKEKGGALWDVIKPKVQDVIDKVKKLYNDYLQPIVDFVVAHKEDIANFFSQALGPLFTLIEAAKELNSLLDKIADKGGGGVKKPYNPPGSGGGGGTTRVGVSRFAAPGVVGTPRGTVRAAAPVVVTVNGALDPEAVARQIRRILAGHDRRVGVAT
jgi:phage-related protein